jgi:phage gp45-like
MKDKEVFRPELKDGDAALYTGEGSYVILREQGDLEIYTRKGGNIQVVCEGNADVRVDGNCDMDVGGEFNIKAAKNFNVKAAKIRLNEPE